MKTLRLVLTDQLSRTLSALQDIDIKQDLILMLELAEDCTQVKHHKKKLVYLLSAMRHFAQELLQRGYNLIYIPLTDSKNTGTLISEITRVVALHQPDKIIVTWPAEYRIFQQLEVLKQNLKIPVEIREDDRFLATRAEFSAWAEGRKELRMEYFYRVMRIKHNILMQKGRPEGGKWNYDSENRQIPKNNLLIPKSYHTEPDTITLEVMNLVTENFSEHFGDILPWHFAVTRAQALDALAQFIDERLEFFGDYQDAMIENEPWMFHSHLSIYINNGLLEPLECIQRAQTAYYERKVPLNAAEGFIRQILGWREYVRGIYWLKMPSYKNLNYLSAIRSLPDFFWSGDTKMNCVAQCVKETRENAYAHHIQRLMVLGNFLLLAGINPAQVNEWYLLVYADAFEWVELPNVTGMILYADGGVLASKPYAASGAYIDKMSNYCKNCQYNVKQKNGPTACPFNYLYWNFLLEHRDQLRGNHRLAMIYSVIDKMSPTKIQDIRNDATEFLSELT